MAYAPLMSDELKNALCEQIGHEKTNASIYMRIASFMNSKGLGNLAKIFEDQHDEEEGHAKMIYDFLMDMSVDIFVPSIPMVSDMISNIVDIAQKYADREIFTTASLDSIKNLAEDENNPLAEEFMRGMLLIQRKETEEFTSFWDNAVLCGADWWKVKVWNDSLGD